jgi:hypothetical protein
LFGRCLFLVWQPGGESVEDWCCGGVVMVLLQDCNRKVLVIWRVDYWRAKCNCMSGQVEGAKTASVENPSPDCGSGPHLTFLVADLQ